MVSDPSPIVSSEEDELILVDSQDREIGHATKAACHDGKGILHRAFSVFLFDPRGRILLQRRAAQKRLWPLHWSNACCSHPRRGESLELAVTRRVREELGLEVPVRFVFKFVYQASFGNVGSEHELCHVFVGKTDGEPTANANEIERWRFIDLAALDGHLLAEPDRYTPWFKLEWRRLRDDYPEVLAALQPI